MKKHVTSQTNPIARYWIASNERERKKGRDRKKERAERAERYREIQRTLKEA